MDSFIEKCFCCLQKERPKDFPEGLQISNISKNDILEAEKLLRRKIPKEFVDFLQSYKLPNIVLLGKFSGRYYSYGRTYSIETDSYIEASEVDDNFVFLDIVPDGIWDIENLADAIKTRSWNESYKFGYIFIGEFRESYYLFYDCKTKAVVYIDHEEIPDSPRRRSEMDNIAIVLFESFQDFLRCCFLGEVYDEDQCRFPLP